MDIAENAKIGKGNGDDDKTVKKSPSKKSSGPTGYLTSLRFGKKMSFS